MKGYRTLAINASGIIVSLAAGFGVGLDPEHVTALVLGIYSAVNIIMRFQTDSKVGEK